MNIYVATGTTANYLPKAERFIQSMSKLNGNIKKIVITLGFEVSSFMRNNYPDVNFIFQDINPLVNELTKINCLQHGAFIDVMDFVNNDDIVIFSDGDVVIQRDITKSEIEYLKTFKDLDIGCNMNNYKARSLKADFLLLQPVWTFDELKAAFYRYDLDDCLGYNTGNLIARPKAWKLLREVYKGEFFDIDESCKHYAKQQLLINMISKKYLNIVETPQTWHTHGCFGLPPFAKIENGLLKVGDEIVLFRHNI